MIKRILLPTDGSAFSERASEYALELAKSFGAELVVVHVVELPSTKRLAPEEVKQEKARRAESCFRSVKEKATSADITVETKMLVSRSVSDALLEESDEGGYDLVVMGSHGLSGMKKLLLGSVSEAMVHHGSKPVLVVK